MKFVVHFCHKNIYKQIRELIMKIEFYGTFLINVKDHLIYIKIKIELINAVLSKQTIKTRHP